MRWRDVSEWKTLGITAHLERDDEYVSLSSLGKQGTSHWPLPIGHYLLLGHIVNITFTFIIHMLYKYLLGGCCVHSTLLGLKKTRRDYAGSLSP